MLVFFDFFVLYLCWANDKYDDQNCRDYLNLTQPEIFHVAYTTIFF